MKAQINSINQQNEGSVHNQLVVTVTDQHKIDLLMEFLGHLDFVRVRKEPITSKVWTQETRSAFLATAGIWKDRDIDAAELRKQAW